MLLKHCAPTSQTDTVKAHCALALVEHHGQSAAPQGGRGLATRGPDTMTVSRIVGAEALSSFRSNSDVDSFFHVPERTKHFESIVAIGFRISGFRL